MPAILITGGSGFIGSHLCDKLLSEGHSVTCVDNLITGSRKNVSHIAGNPGFRFIERDIVNGLDDIKGPFDLVFHMASPASPPDYLRHPIETLLTGSIGTHKTLDVATRDKSVFLLASTSEVYGDPEIHPQTETYWGNVNSIGPRSCYDEAKRYAEAATMAYHRSRGTDIRIVRIFNTYGPRMRVNDGRAVANFICQALQGEDITVYGDGSQTRSLCFVSDLVEGIVRMMKSGSPGVPVNLGNPVEMTMLELAEMVIKFTGSKSRIIHNSLPEDDPKKRKPDISRARESLGWEPKVKLEEGLMKTIAYFRAELGV
ncbi:MAG: SDR family oxidoreductase [Nitrospinae bacterium]|nr:SDR family oxidoreductase [Nitrospinota bacterium]MBF0635127.1 SDR family oxidoreductase [Nitrospinota bacterium]